MAMIYDLDNEGGGAILSDTDTGAPALQVNSNAAGQPGLALLSTVSGNPLVVSSLGSPASFRSATTVAVALQVTGTVNSSPTIARFRILGPSSASGAVIGFGAGFISVVSILGIAATGAAIGFDYVLPVEVNGVQRGIPLTSLISLPGAAAF